MSKKELRILRRKISIQNIREAWKALHSIREPKYSPIEGTESD